MRISNITTERKYNILILIAILIVSILIIPYQTSWQAISNSIAASNNLGNRSRSNALVTGINIGGNPVAIAVNPTTNMIYVANAFSKKMSFIDGNIDSQINTAKVISIQSNALAFRSSVAVNPIRNLLYVTNVDSGKVSLIDGAEGIIVGNLTVRGNAYSIALNPKSNDIFVVTASPNSYNGTLYKIDGNFNSINYAIPLGGYPIAVAVNTKTNMVYVSLVSGNVIGIRGDIGKIAANIKIGSNSTAMGLAVNPTTNMIYVTNREAGTVSVINGSTNNVMKNVTVGGGPRDIAVNPTTNMAYVANGDSGTVSIINGSTNNVVAGVTFNINPPNGGDIYCNQTKISDKDYVRYDVGSHIDCNVNAHSGFRFSSWSSNLDFNSSDTMTTPFTISRYGNSTANFVSITPISIPQEYLVTLVGVIISFLIPSIASWWNGRRQRG